MIRLADGTATAEIAPLGAELRAWSVDGTPLIWTPDPASWAETAPILFPIVGWTRGGGIKVAGKRYALGLHGFARTMLFRVLEQWPAHARLALAASPETRALYPFEWTLEVHYMLDAGALQVKLIVRNEGDGPMPYACGLHPGFRWPFAGGAPEDYQLLFDERETPAVPVISPEGLFTDDTRRVPLDGRRLDLSTALLSKEALCFLDARSRRLRFGRRSGAAIEIALENFPHIALWSRPPGRFLSIEAWTGHGDHVDADGDLFHKAGMRHLPPGATATHAAKFSFAPPHVLFR